ncbi:DUF1491 family protein [Telmatospirillum sp. J64-1]|uniref:DUF1491 family protein n=1 Tax=Telmatospirillum sp. J64-1 TaxID=2502183 RepID=UPI00115DB6A3|nr:DUF1491 family protein [Telmatospirillum sp. J64-1]
MTEAKLKSKLWIQAAIRRCEIEAIPAMVVRRGDADAGAILIKLNRLDGTCEVLSQARDAQGNLVWMRSTGPDPVPEEKADSYIARQVTYDSDLWVLEVEDRQGRLPFLEKII